MFKQMSRFGRVLIWLCVLICLWIGNIAPKLGPHVLNSWHQAVPEGEVRFAESGSVKKNVSVLYKSVEEQCGTSEFNLCKVIVCKSPALFKHFREAKALLAGWDRFSV